ncbi:MAG: hypothetical protein M3R04_01705 [bacterium]|nr:hypothetical protein [bacterium]
MGRTDARALEVPEALPMMPVDTDAVVAVAAQTQALEQFFSDRAEALTKALPATTCPSCNAKLSVVEQKFERCLSCGKTFSVSNADINVGL